MNKYFAVLLFITLPTYFCGADQKLRVENLVFVNSEFYGSGAENSSYVIKAQESRQVDTDVHELKNIVVNYDTGNSKNHIFLKSNKGIFNNTNNMMELFSNIEIRFNSLYNLYTDKIYVNFAESRVFTNDKSEIKGVNESILSERGFVANMNERVVDFSGPITTIMIRK